VTKGFWVLWGFDAVIALVTVGFFFVGLADGSVSSFNIRLWVVILGALALVMLGSLRLRTAGRLGPATVLLLVLAAPGLCFVLFFAVVLIANPRWN
jgi:hypothetical protein